MPTVLFLNGFKFFFYSNENNEPIHVHKEKADSEGKVWLEPIITIAYLHKFSAKEVKDILNIIDDNVEQFKTKWNEFFNK